MEVRCAGCNKLFRVADEKITGAGIKFPCSRCGNAVKITSEEFEQYKLSREAASALASFAPKPSKEAVAALFDTDGEAHQPAPSSPHPDFDLSDPASAAASMQQEEEQPPLFVKPEAEPEPAVAVAPPRPAAPAPPSPVPSVKPATAEPPRAEPAPVTPAASAARPTVPVQPKVPPRPAPPVRPAQPEGKSAPRPAAPTVRPASASSQSQRPAPVVVSASQPAGSGSGLKVAVVIVAVILLGAGGFFAKSFFVTKAPARQSLDIGKEVTPEGLQVVSASGGVDPVSGDLIISGVIENTTDKARPAWYVVVDLLDAQGTTVMQAKLVSGKPFYTRRDMEVLGKRGTNMQEFRTKQLQDQGVTIPARGTVNFEIRVLEPPIGVANFNATLQPFDPVKLYKEISEEQK